MMTSIDSITITYKGKEVSARKLTVSSIIPLGIDIVWHKVKTSAVLVFVARGMITFQPSGGKFPDVWQESTTVTTRMRLYGIIPMGGLHSLRFEKVDNENNVLQTRESDASAKVWDHRISLKANGTDSTFYQDEIIIYGGALTGLITFWAKLFYIHRQKRWQLIASNFTK
jgi:hypothetical protein